MDLPPGHTRLFAEQVRALRATLRDTPTAESWEACEDAWNQAIALAVAPFDCPLRRAPREITLRTPPTYSASTGVTVGVPFD